MTEHQANSIYDILASTCGATEYWRADFIHHATNNDTLEYRFQGSLGFGGKVFIERRGVRVSCYSEDRNPERELVIFKANGLLRKLPTS